MLEVATMPPQPTYREFIKEAFIDPIRTAVIIDDEYPTLDELLIDVEPAAKKNAQDAAREVKKNENKSRVQKIVKFCRAQQPTPWLVDVHDGRTPTPEGEVASVSHLESSDLLVLDYHLDGNVGSDKAINILRRLAGNGHFNLVVVYTKDRDATGTGIDRTINEIAISLASPATKFNIPSPRERAYEKKIEAWEEVEEDIFVKLLDSLDEVAYLKVLHQNDCVWENVKKIPELANLGEYLVAIPEGIKITPDQVLELLMHKRQSLLKEKMSSDYFGKVTIGKQSDDVNWIRADSLFVTVVSKEHEPETIPSKLLDALEAWDPVPHRLIMSKMRNSLVSSGGMAESHILMNRHLQASWLAELLEEDDAKRRTSVRQSVARHWESLGGKIEPGVLDFAGKIANHLSKSADKNTLFSRFDKYAAFDQKIDLHMHMNIHACSKPVDGHHLSTGQVLRVGPEGHRQYWLCLTPLCDLEPAQSEMKGWSKRLGDWLPFKAVRLYPADKEIALGMASRGYHLFLNEDCDQKVFTFSETNQNSISPTLGWEQFFAKNQGRFDSDNSFDIASIGKNGDLSFEQKTAVVVAQIRYEYALNLMQKLGSHLSRVGLDFVSYSVREKSTE